METPPSVPTEFVSDTETARQVIAEALAAGKTWLDPLDVNRLFDAYGIPVSPAILARDGKEAAAAARPFLAARAGRGGEGPLARHHPQVGRGRRAPQSDQREGG